MHAEDMQMVLLPVGWETDAIPDLQDRGQAIINRQLVDNCDLLIGIFRNRLGTPTSEAESGTVEEIERADSQGKRCIVYFSDKEFQLSDDNQEQYERLQNYRKELNSRGLTNSYTTSPDFREKISRHLTQALREIAKEDRERRAAENEAKIAEKSIGIAPQPIQKSDQKSISFDTLSSARNSIKFLLESRFGIQDLEDIKEQEISKVQNVIDSSELAELLSRPASSENVPTVVQILETASKPSMLALASIARYADDESLEWLDIAGEWIERLSTKKVEGGYVWASHIKTYPGLLLLYALGLSSLRSGKIGFLKEVTSRQVYLREYRRDEEVLVSLNPWNVFYNGTSKFIEPGFERRFTPVSDHLTSTLKDILYPIEEEARYLDWFDLFEFLLSFKSVELLDEYTYFGSFMWRNETERFRIKSFQDAAISQGRCGPFISGYLGGEENIRQTALKYDEIANRSQRGFGRACPPNYTTHLIQLAKNNIKVSSHSELLNILQGNR